jgi:hypothetical protein
VGAEVLHVKRASRDVTAPVGTLYVEKQILQLLLKPLFYVIKDIKVG